MELRLLSTRRLCGVGSMARNDHDASTSPMMALSSFAR
jgi:hypothetical protein